MLFLFEEISFRVQPPTLPKATPPPCSGGTPPAEAPSALGVAHQEPGLHYKKLLAHPWILIITCQRNWARGSDKMLMGSRWGCCCDLLLVNHPYSAEIRAAPGVSALLSCEFSQCFSKTRKDRDCQNQGWHFKDLQDGRGVRCGDHLPPHKYIKNTLHVEQLLQNTYWMLEEDLRLPKFCFLLLICFWFFVFDSLAFSVCFYFGVVWLLFFVFSFFVFVFLSVGVCFFVCYSLFGFAFTICLGVLSVHFLVFFPFLPHCATCRVLVLWSAVGPETLRWESWVQDSGPPENSWPQGILISKSSPRGFHLNNKTWLHPRASKLQCWTPHTKQLARQEHNPIH